ncbi:unnamed protein product, partial [Rotaria socialis]
KLFYFKVSAKSIQQIPLNPDDSKRSGHYAKKRLKSNKKSTSTADESIPMDEHEHTEMLRIAKVSRHQSEVFD